MTDDEIDDDEPDADEDDTPAPARSQAERLFGDAQGVKPADNAVRPPSAPPATGLFAESSAGAPGAWTTDATERDLFGADHAPSTTEMFPIETALRPALHERHDDVMTVLQLGEAERHQRHRAFTAAIRESGVDPNTTGQALYHLLVDAEVAAVRGQVARPADDAGEIPALPPRMVEDVLRQVRAWLGPERGERLVVALHDYVEAQPGLARILATPGVVSSPRFRPVLDQLIEHVRVTERI